MENVKCACLKEKKKEEEGGKKKEKRSRKHPSDRSK